MPSYLYSEDVVARTPSMKDGVDPETETNNRLFSCEIINQAGIMLKLPQATISTAQIILHRFYYRVPMTKYRCLPVAMTSLFLATKVEESTRKPRDVLNVFDRLLKKRFSQPLTVFDVTSEKFKKWSDNLKRMELIILRELGYVIYVDHPHKFFLYYINCLELSKEVAQRAWNFLNDSMRTNVCVRYRPEVVATATIYLAARILQIKLPDKWYEVFDTDREDLEEVGSTIADLYTRPKLEYKSLGDSDAASNELVDPVKIALEKEKKAEAARIKRDEALMKKESKKEKDKDRDKDNDKDNDKDSKDRGAKKEKDEDDEKDKKDDKKKERKDRDRGRDRSKGRGYRDNNRDSRGGYKANRNRRSRSRSPNFSKRGGGRFGGKFGSGKKRGFDGGSKKYNRNRSRSPSYTSGSFSDSDSFSLSRSPSRTPPPRGRGGGGRDGYRGGGGGGRKRGRFSRSRSPIRKEKKKKGSGYGGGGKRGDGGGEKKKKAKDSKKKDKGDKDGDRDSKKSVKSIVVLKKKDKESRDRD